MTWIPGIKQISQVGNDMYAQGAFPLGIGTTNVDYLADPADTRLLAGRDPVLEEISVGMSGVETDMKYVTGAQPLTVTDAMQGNLAYCGVQFSPKQDLHGYDAPWPAGGGKNLFNKDGTLETGKYLKNDGSTVDDSGWSITDYIPVSGTTFTIQGVAGNTPSIILYDANKLFLAGQKYGTHDTVTISSESTASYCRFSIDNNVGVNSIQLEAGSTATTWSPYSNLCPISGWTGAEVTVAGKNLLKGTAYQYSSTQVRLGGESVDEWYQLLKAGTYTISWKYTGTGSPTAYYRDKNTGTNTTIGSNGTSFTLTEDKKIGIYAYKSGSLDMDDFEQWQLEIGSTPSSYVPYRAPSTSSVTFPTSYGGRINLTDGTGDNDTAEVDLTTVRIIYQAASSTETTDCYRLVPDNMYDDNVNRKYAKTSLFGDLLQSPYGIYVQIPKQSTQSEAVGRQWMLDNGMQIVYYLATPPPFTFPGAHSITLQEGTNTLWADTNGTDISVTYVTKK